MKNSPNYAKAFYLFEGLGALLLWNSKPFGWFVLLIAVALHIYGECINMIATKMLVQKFEREQLQIMIGNTEVMEKELLDLYHNQINNKD